MWGAAKHPPRDEEAEDRSGEPKSGAEHVWRKRLPREKPAQDGAHAREGEQDGAAPAREQAKIPGQHEAADRAGHEEESRQDEGAVHHRGAGANTEAADRLAADRIARRYEAH